MNNNAPSCDQHRNYQQVQKNVNNGQNSPFVTSPAHVNPYQHSHLPIQIVNPFARTSLNSQSNFQSGNSRASTSHFTPPDVMNDEDKAYVQLYQQLHRENVDDDKHTDGLKKTDYAEFPSGDRITPEIYLAWRYSLEMTARVQGVSEIIDPHTWLRILSSVYHHHHRDNQKWSIIGPIKCIRALPNVTTRSTTTWQV